MDRESEHVAWAAMTGGAAQALKFLQSLSLHERERLPSVFTQLRDSCWDCLLHDPVRFMAFKVPSQVLPEDRKPLLDAMDAAFSGGSASVRLVLLQSSLEQIFLVMSTINRVLEVAGGHPLHAGTISRGSILGGRFPNAR